MLYGLRHSISIFASFLLVTSFTPSAVAESTQEPFAYQFTTEPITDSEGNKFHSEITVYEIDLTAPEAADQIAATSLHIQENLKRDSKIPKAFISLPLSENTKKILKLNSLINSKQETELDHIVLGDEFDAQEKFNIELEPEALGLKPENFANHKAKTGRSIASNDEGVISSSAWGEIDRLYKEQFATFRYRLIYIRGFGNGKFTTLSVLRGGTGPIQAIILGTLAGAMSGFAQKHTKFLGDYVTTKEYSSKFKNMLRRWVGLQEKPVNTGASKALNQYVKWGTTEVTFAGIFTIVADAMGTLPSPEIFGHSLVGLGGHATSVVITSAFVMIGQGSYENMRTLVAKSKAAAFLKEGKLAAAILVRKNLDKAFTLGSFVAVSGMAMKMLGVNTGSYIALGALVTDAGITFARYKIPAFDRAMSKVDNKLKPVLSKAEEALGNVLTGIEKVIRDFKCKYLTKKKPRDIRKSDIDDLGQTI